MSRKGRFRFLGRSLSLKQLAFEAIALMEVRTVTSMAKAVVILVLLVPLMMDVSLVPTFRVPLVLIASGTSKNIACERDPLPISPNEPPCKIPLTPGKLITRSAPERLTAGEQFEIVFSRHLFWAKNCSLPARFDPNNGQDIFAASVQRVNQQTGDTDIIVDAAVSFIQIVQDRESGETSAEYSIRGRIFDAGTYTVKLLQMYHSVTETGLSDLLLVNKASPDDDLRSVSFLQGFSPLAYGEVQWAWSGTWFETWELQVEEAETMIDETRDCADVGDLFVGRWVRIEGVLKWKPYGCAVGTDLTCFKGKRILMVGASVMRTLFNALARLLGVRDQYASGHLDANIWAPEHSSNLTYHVEFNCGPWAMPNIADSEYPDFIIGTCGSHVWQEDLSKVNGDLAKLHEQMRKLVLGKGAKLIWMTTNPFNPDRDISSWRSKVLEALPRFEEINRGQKEVIGHTPLVDWYAMARPILMYTRDQVHFSMGVYEELARVLAHVLCSLKDRADSIRDARQIV